MYADRNQEDDQCVVYLVPITLLLKIQLGNPKIWRRVNKELECIFSKIKELDCIMWLFCKNYIQLFPIKILQNLMLR